MTLVPSMLSQVFRTESSWLQRLLTLRRWLVSGFLRSAKWIWNSSGTRVLGARMHSLRKFLELSHELCCSGSLGSLLMPLVLKLLLDIVVVG